MIAFFPEPYPDELLYSQLARCFMKSGYYTYSSISKELYVNTTSKPSIDFLNRYTPETVKVITKTLSMEEVIMKHTMFPYYGRFLNKERRVLALRSLVSMSEEAHHVLFTPRYNKDRMLRYCPVCASEDRKRYGETYWHRKHQIKGVDMCAEHRCLLLDSNIAIKSRAKPELTAAEDIVPEQENYTMVDAPQKLQYTEYLTEVFHADMNMNLDVIVSDYLYSKLQYTPYTTNRGGKKHLKKFINAFVQHYDSIGIDYSLKEIWKFEKIFCNQRFEFQEICMVAMFLNITVDELVQMCLPRKSKMELYDEKVMRLYQSGLSKKEIARQMHTSEDIIYDIIAKGEYKRCV